MDGLQSYSLEVITIDVKRKEAKVGVIERSTFEGDSGEPVEQAVIGALALRKEDDAWRISGIYF